MGKSHQIEVIKYLLVNGWKDDDQTHSETYRIITAKSYPLAGGQITTGGKPRFKKRDWKIGVGVNSTVIYKKPEKPETIKGQGRMMGRDLFTFRDWEMYNIRTRDIAQIKAKLKQLKLVGSWQKGVWRI